MPTFQAGLLFPNRNKKGCFAHCGVALLSLVCRMQFKPIPLWKEAPFIRYIIPFVTGIIIQWNYSIPLFPLVSGAVAFLSLILAFNYFSISVRFGWYRLAGIALYLLLFLLACILVHENDIRNNKSWIGHYLEAAETLVPMPDLKKNRASAGTSEALITAPDPRNHIVFADISETIDALIVTLEEPLEEKAKSFKALATINRIVRNDSLYPSCGRIILYLEKKNTTLTAGNEAPADIAPAMLPDSTKTLPGLGSRLLIRPRLQPIEDFENPTGFSYKHYCALQNIYHRQFLKAGDYIILPDKNSSPFRERLFVLRQHIITILCTYIKGEKEAGLAEALLIGYKNDLDKKLVQSYTNTGVVHVIAISGLHVGLIYSILLMLLVPLTAHRYARWMRPFLLLAGLWIFSLLAGGAPSVVRSTVMFSGIVLGKSLRKGNSIYNSLAASAFLLLCYNPLWLWEVGFQLSYLAVLSIVMFMNPIYNLLYVQNKMLDPLWKMAAITLSAQILTTPVCLYYFHQFPNLFLITNIVAVPLSSLILAGELLLCGLAFFPAAAAFTGQILEWLIRCLNSFITYMEKMPFALSTGLGISIYQVIILYGIIVVMAAIRKRT